MQDNDNKTLIKKVLLPLDGSDNAFRAAKYALKIAECEKSQLLLIHVIGHPQYLSEFSNGAMVLSYYLEESRKQAEKWFKEVSNLAQGSRIEIVSEVFADVLSIVDSIVNYADKNNADLIVMGTKGRTGIKKFLLGSVANGVLMHAHCPVLVVR